MTANKKAPAKKAKSAVERRKAPRYRTTLHLHLVFDDLDDLREAYSRDISENGIFVAGDQLLPVGSIVQLRISIVHEDITYVNAKGEVMHVIEAGEDNEPGMGVKFIDISDEAKQFLKEYVIEKVARKARKKTTSGKKKRKASARKGKGK